MNDVVINKIATIERCLQRINVVYAEVEDNYLLILHAKIPLY
ncbi:MAG: hypothetical protein ACI9C4_001697 [Paraglaciecola sp.]|jgi:hypothetical protein